MKRVWKVLSLALVVVMLLSVTAFAEDSNDKATITDVAGSGATATFAEGSDEKITVTFQSTAIIEGGQYLILMVKGTKEDYSITEDSILYIDQVSGSSEGSITFTVYPSSIQSSIILIAGAGVNGERGPLVAAIVEGNYILGDVDGDNAVTTSDAAKILRVVAGLESMTDDEKAAANVDSDTAITTSDAAKILRVVAGLDTLS